jgi:cysteine desulfurase
MKTIYLDHAAATPVDPAVLKAMKPFFSDAFANPSSFHTDGLEVQRALADARTRIAQLINAHAEEVIFCSGGTESDNLAIQGIVRAHAAQGTHVITSSIEHHAVLELLKRMEKKKEIELTVVGVDADGIIAPQDVIAAIRKDTVLISIMAANNEIGTIQPIAEIGKELLKYRKAHESAYPYFHTDACQYAGAGIINPEVFHADLITFNASKIYGPKGAGALFVRRGIKLEPMIIGGGHERGIRSGTENVPAIIGLAEALERSTLRMEKENVRLTGLRDRLIEGLLKIPKSRLNGHATKRLPNNANITFLDIEGEAALLYLDAQGVRCSTGSACASSSLDPSHVILALGVSYEAAHGSLRFSLGRSTTKEQIDEVIRIMPGIVEKLRHMSPVNLDMKYFENAVSDKR